MQCKRGTRVTHSDIGASSQASISKGPSPLIPPQSSSTPLQPRPHNPPLPPSPIHSAGSGQQMNATPAGSLSTPPSVGLPSPISYPGYPYPTYAAYPMTPPALQGFPTSPYYPPMPPPPPNARDPALIKEIVQEQGLK